MIYTPELCEIEVDATSLDPSGNPALVDDVIVRYNNSTLYVQAKKNQTDFRAWSLGDLADELKKAWTQWRRDPSARLLFISRNDFGDIAKLKEYATTQPTPEAFERSLTAELKDVACKVVSYDAQAGNHADLLEFLRRLDFETINPQRFRSDLIGQLRLHVAHAETAFDCIKTRIDAISRRETQQGDLTISPHKLDRQELHQLLHGGGVEFCLPIADQEAVRSLSQLSQIGRSWQRKIGNSQLSRPVVGELLERIRHKPPCLLLSAGPGVGKSCALLSVLEYLEQESGALPVFIQAREFAAAREADEREALGFPKSLVSDVARLSETRHVVVLIDSIDVLSIARDHLTLSFALSLIDRLRLIPNVTVIAACRSFDIKYDGRLSDRDWGETIEIELLDWDKDVSPLVAGIGIEPDQISADTRELLRTPRLLAIFHDIVKTGSVPIARTGQELTEQYLQRVVRDSPMLGDAAMISIMEASRWMLDNRRLDIPLASSRIPQEIVRPLLSAGVLVETHQRGLSFAHQTLLDALAVAHAKANGETLAAFIRTRAAAPFIRPTVRSFLFSLRMDDIAGFRRQVREVVDADDIAFHLRRLVVESFAEMAPTADDWPLFRHLYTSNPTLFNAFYVNAGGAAWLDFFHAHWLDLLIRNQDGPWLVRLMERMAASEDFSDRFIDIWKQAFDWTWVDQQQLRWISPHLLEKFSNWQAPGLREVFERLIADKENDHGSLGKPLSKWVSATDANDDLLWRYITRRVDPEDIDDIQFGQKLECDSHTFMRDDYLSQRMQLSEALLDLAMDDVETWSEQRRRSYEAARELTEGFLRETSHDRVHSARDMHHVDGLNILLSALETACKYHAALRTPWWQRNVNRFRNSRDAALRYFAIQVFTENPELHIADASALLRDGVTLNYHRFRWEVGLLLNATFPYLSPEQQEEIQILARSVDDDYRDHDGNLPDWVILARRELLAHIPTCFRTQATQAVIDHAETLAGSFSRSPAIESSGGWVRSPVPHEFLLELSDDGLLRLLRHFSLRSPDRDRWEISGVDGLVGGADHVVREVQEAASRQPTRFMRFYEAAGADLDPEYAEAILAGIATQLRYRFGNLGKPQQWSAIEEPEGSVVADWLVRQLELRYDFWVGRRDMATILQAASGVLESDEDCERITFLLLGCLSSDDPGPDREDVNDRLMVAINSTRGVAAEAAFTLANGRLESARVLPALLVEVLKRCASDPHPSVRALVLRSLPFVLYHHQELGWTLFDRALLIGDAQSWKHAYNCLYYNYHQRFPIVSGYLSILRADRSPEALELWSRISALSCLAGHIPFDVLMADLREIGLDDVWAGAASIFAANLNEPRLRESCTQGLLASLEGAKDKDKVLGKMSRLFSNSTGHPIDPTLIKSYFSAVARREAARNRDVHGVGIWLVSIGITDPECALAAIETILEYSAQLDRWDGAPYAKLMTALFREAEERELSDQGQFLSRVVAVQDALLRLGMRSLDGWLKDAERP
ncbi:hypothetical protein [Tahibacter caeni]|uniref:hypothetical protein n=1 Tax=Tahibacter caeni TaxID=1453545 RepID=UPI002147D9EF|nr:hypothetical protein [Tahibacter caeni]